MEALKKYVQFFVLATVGVASLTSAAPLASSLTETDVDGWQDTALTLDAVQESLVNDTNCRTGAIAFTACLNALATTLTEAAPSSRQETSNDVLVFVPNEFYAKQKTWFTGATETIGDFTLVHFAPFADKEIKLFVKRRDSILVACVAAFRAGRAKFYFDKQVQRLPSNVVTAATLANAYYGVVVDPHTYLIPSSAILKPVRYVGIGTTLQLTKNGYYIIPLPNSPAVTAGIREGDLLEGIDGVSIEGLSIQNIGRRLRGALASSLKLTIRRDGQKLDISIFRSTIVRENIDIDLIEENSRKIAHVKLRNFLADSCTNLREKLVELRRQKIDGVIFDLRDNPGGSSQEAVCVTSLFVAKGLPIVKLATTDWEYSKGSETFSWPMTILVNGGSASATEITAGALQEYERAWIVGERTYGKGTSQKVGTSGVNGVSMATTEGLYIFKSWRSPQLVGVLPEFEVFRDALVKKEEDSIAIREEDQIRPLASSIQHYFRPANLVPLRETRLCVQANGQAKKSYDKIYQAGKPADLQLLTALDVLACQQQTKDLKISRKLSSLLAKQNCSEVRTYLDETEKQLANFYRDSQETDALVKADKFYTSTLQFYRAQRRLAEQNISSEIETASEPLGALASKCGFAFKLRRDF